MSNMKRPALFLMLLFISILFSTVLVSTTIAGMLKTFKGDNDKSINAKTVLPGNQAGELKHATVKL